MDVTKLQKANQMTKELQKHGIAADSQEGYEQAQKMFNTEKLKTNKVEKPAEQNNDSFSKIERNVDMLKKGTDERLNAMQATLSDVVSRMNEMIKIINELEKLKDGISSASAAPAQKERQKKIQDTKQAPKNEKRGDYEPGDIDVTQVFNFGKK
jgi:uncharacterized phage infection (PIP) family protein YhgE